MQPHKCILNFKLYLYFEYNTGDISQTQCFWYSPRVSQREAHFLFLDIRWEEAIVFTTFDENKSIKNHDYSFQDDPWSLFHVLAKQTHVQYTL